jgi:hypothetical protein
LVKFIGEDRKIKNQIIAKVMSKLKSVDAA